MSDLRNAKSIYQDSLDKLEAALDMQRECESRGQILSDKASKCAKALEQDQSTHHAKLMVRQREAEALENKIVSRLDPVALEEQIAAYERQCTELETMIVEHEQQGIAERSAVHAEISQACELMLEHEEHFRYKLSELSDYWHKNVLSEMKSQEDGG